MEKKSKKVDNFLKREIKELLEKIRGAEKLIERRIK